MALPGRWCEASHGVLVDDLLLGLGLIVAIGALIAVGVLGMAQALGQSPALGRGTTLAHAAAFTLLKKHTLGDG